jgi:hypothetical protein
MRPVIFPRGLFAAPYFDVRRIGTVSVIAVR